MLFPNISRLWVARQRVDEWHGRTLILRDCHGIVFEPAPRPPRSRKLNEVYHTRFDINQGLQVGI